MRGEGLQPIPGESVGSESIHVLMEIPAAHAGWWRLSDYSRTRQFARQFLRQGDPNQLRFADAAALGLRSKAGFELLGQINADAVHTLTVPHVGSRAYDLFWGTGLRATTIAHRVLDKVSGGRLMRRFPGGSQVVWINTLGRKSGEWRRTPLLGVPVNTTQFQGWGIAGSNAGQEKVPGWVFNVRANPDGQIQIDDDVLECTFTEVDGDLARDIYARLGNSWSSYRMYERNIKRSIPIFVATIQSAQTETSAPS